MLFKNLYKMQLKEILYSIFGIILGLAFTFYISYSNNKEIKALEAKLTICTTNLEDLKRNNDFVVDTIRKQLYEKEKIITELANTAKRLKPKYEAIKNTKFTKSDTALLESLYRTIQHPIER